MGNLFELNVATRNSFGKAASRRMRRVEELVPAIIYGGTAEPTHITVKHHVAQHALENEAFYSHILTLNVDGKTKEQVILKEVQRFPGRPIIQHLDFYRINMKEKLNMHIPIHYHNAEKAPGVLAGGVVNHHLSELEIRCLPSDLPEHIDIDLSKLGLDEVIHLTQITLPKGVELVALAHGEDHSHDHAVVSIHIPAAYEEPTEETEAAAAAEAEAKPESAEGNEAEASKE